MLRHFDQREKSNPRWLKVPPQGRDDTVDSSVDRSSVGIEAKSRYSAHLMAIPVLPATVAKIHDDTGLLQI